MDIQQARQWAMEQVLADEDTTGFQPEFLMEKAEKLAQWVMNGTPDASQDGPVVRSGPDYGRDMGAKAS